jgi:hypothetical protein
MEEVLHPSSLCLYEFALAESLYTPLSSTLIALIRMFSPAASFLPLEVQNTCLAWLEHQEDALGHSRGSRWTELGM